jgi:hypothetical protein
VSSAVSVFIFRTDARLVRLISHARAAISDLHRLLSPAFRVYMRCPDERCNAVPGVFIGVAKNQLVSAQHCMVCVHIHIIFSFVSAVLLFCA